VVSLNDPFAFRRRRLARAVAEEVDRTPGDPWGAARRAWARLSDDKADLATVTLAAVEAAVACELRGRGVVRDEDGMLRFVPPDGAA
jgi:hypothetical protein